MATLGKSYKPAARPTATTARTADGAGLSLTAKMFLAQDDTSVEGSPQSVVFGSSANTYSAGAAGFGIDFREIGGNHPFFGAHISAVALSPN